MQIESTNSSGEYGEFLQSIKSRVTTAQLNAALTVNRSLILLYWEIGCEILDRQEKQGWGAKVIERLSRDLFGTFPEMKGFSPRNLKYMRKLAEAYPDRDFVQQAVAQIPWGHNLRILDKAKTEDERVFYIHQTITNGWSRNILALQIKGMLFERQGKAVTNFQLTLPPPQSDLANAVLKDPYNFDFLTVGKNVHERDIENALLHHLHKFLLELGVGFAFVGNQYHLEVGDQDFYIDLLFYHLKLRCFIVVDLKMREFQPEDGGKMNFYLSAVDDLLRNENDKPSIGLILCREKNRIIAEYAIQGILKPIGVSEFHITHALPDNLTGSLPTVEDLEKTASDTFVDRINRVGIEPDELLTALKRRQEREDLEPGIEGNVHLLVDQFGKGEHEKVSALMFRIWALISLLSSKKLPEEWVDFVDTEGMNVFEPVLRAAATEPMHAHGNELVFDIERFIKRVETLIKKSDLAEETNSNEFSDNE